MSRFRPDRLYLGIEAHRITLVRVAGWWRPSIIAAEQLELPADELDAQLLPLLDRELRSPRWRGARAHAVLADTWVRYFIASVPDGARSRHELREAAALRFEEVFGEDARDWTVKVNLAPLATDHLGCALRAHWLGNLLHTCQEAGLPLLTVTPFGISEFNRNERHIGHRSGWFAAMGTDTVWLAFKSRNNWRSTHIHHGHQDEIVTHLPQCLARAQLHAGLDLTSDRNLWLAGRFVDSRTLSGIAGTAIRSLGVPHWPGQDGAWSQTYRLALSPVWPACD